MKTPIPKTMRMAWFKNLPTMRHEALIKLGLKIWNKNKIMTHYLYPDSWYNEIPNGLTVTDIFGKPDIFKNGVTDNDQRFGALPFGFIKLEKKK